MLRDHSLEGVSYGKVTGKSSVYVPAKREIVEFRKGAGTPQPSIEGYFEPVCRRAPHILTKGLCKMQRAYSASRISRLDFKESLNI
jgi:hypothetical protein